MAGKSKTSSVKYGSSLSKYQEFITKASEMQRRPYLSLGPLSMNLAVGNSGGIEMGRIIQLNGKQSSGKTTLALDIIQQYQKINSDDVLFVDFERSLDPDYAQSCGVDLDRLLRVHPDFTEQGFDIIEAALQEDVTKLVVIDSVAAAKPSSEEGKSYSDSPKMASSAGLITRFCNRITPILDNTGASVLLINQLRANFSLLSHEKEVPFGGWALRFYSALNVHLTITKREEGRQTVQAVVQKNKKGAPQKRIEFFIDYGVGVDHASDIINLGISLNLVESKGSWLSYKDQKIQGAERAKSAFDLEQLKKEVLEAHLAKTD